MRFSWPLPRPLLHLISGLCAVLLALRDARQETSKVFKAGTIWGGPHSAAPMVDLSGHHMMFFIGLAAVGGYLILVGCQQIIAKNLVARLDLEVNELKGRD